VEAPRRHRIYRIGRRRWMCSRTRLSRPTDRSRLPPGRPAEGTGQESACTDAPARRDATLTRLMCDAIMFDPFDDASLA
jgi:hypothetical protein